MQKSNPIFIAGPHRSATSHLRRVISEVFNIPSTVEGYIWPIVTPSFIEYERIVHSALGENVGNTFFIKRVSKEDIFSTIMSSIDKLHQSYFKSTVWLDKTPGHEMIHTLPYLNKFYNDAKFIFIKRNGIENVLSRERRFPSGTFENHCEMWNLCMKAWEEVKDEMKTNILVIEQLNLQLNAEDTAIKIINYLGTDKSKQEIFATQLKSSTTEKTTIQYDERYKTLEDSEWNLSKMGIFIAYCYYSMINNGYPVFRKSDLKLEILGESNFTQWCKSPTDTNNNIILHPANGNDNQPHLTLKVNSQNGFKGIKIKAFAINKNLKSDSIPLIIKVNSETLSNKITINEPLWHDYLLEQVRSEVVLEFSFLAANEKFSAQNKGCLISLETLN